MPFPGFELACVAILALALAAMARFRPWRELLLDYLALAVAGWIGEETCIAWYRHYAYADAWHAHLDHVPLLIPLIWPLVILSARQVADAVAPAAGWYRPLVVAGLVVADASLIEVIAVRAGLWSWSEGGHLGVPVLGILGWGFFAGGADWALARHRAWLLGALAATHALILISWWGCFRWMLRGPLGDASLVGLGLLSASALVLGLRARRAGHLLPIAVTLPRLIATSLFVVVLVRTAGDDVRLWLHVAAIALPYLAVSEVDVRR